jgi:hypothetical protein
LNPSFFPICFRNFAVVMMRSGAAQPTPTAAAAAAAAGTLPPVAAAAAAEAACGQQQHIKYMHSVFKACWCGPHKLILLHCCVRHEPRKAPQNHKRMWHRPASRWLHLNGVNEHQCGFRMPVIPTLFMCAALRQSGNVPSLPVVPLLMLQVLLPYCPDR